MNGQRKRRRANRRDRRAGDRSQNPLLKLPYRILRNPLPPLEWASPEQVAAIHDASLEILEEVGLDFFDDEVLDIWERAGAKVDRASQHAWLDRGLVLEAVARAPAQFTWRARNPSHDVPIGGNHIVFSPNSSMPYVASLDKGRRVGTMEDLQNFIKLAQMVPLIHFGGGTFVEPQDVPASLRHLRRMLAIYKLTDKVVRDAAHGRIITADNVTMARIAFGGQLPPEPVIGGVINVNSPLRYDERMLGGLVTYARAGQVCIITPFIMAGAMSPITMASALAQQNAEALAGIALTQLIRPGAPVIYGGFTMNVDMRSGSPAFGSPEGVWALLVGAQMARHYGIPYRSSGSLTNAKVPDAQAAYETMWTMWPAILAHANLIMHAVGWLEAGLVASYEKFIIDMESLGMFAHLLNGFPIARSEMALDKIAEVGPGGHHFGTDHTQARFASAFYQPFLSDRDGYDNWVSGGSQDAALRANAIWKKLLLDYEAPAPDPSTLEALEAFAARRERELEGVDLYS